MTVLIRDFGNDTECENVLELETVLFKRYKNDSVSLIRTLPSGIKKVSYVDVSDDCVITDSYTHELFNLLSLFTTSSATIN